MAPFAAARLDSNAGTPKPAESFPGLHNDHR